MHASYFIANYVNNNIRDISMTALQNDSSNINNTAKKCTTFSKFNTFNLT